MPRPGAVTRSMTRAGEAALISSSEQAPAKDLADGGTSFYHVSATIQKDRVDERSNSKPAVTTTLTSGDNPINVLSAELLIKNRMTIIRLEQDGILTPGILTMMPSGELCADLSVEPDVGTMAGLYPNMAPRPDTEKEIPSWLRDYLLKILNVHGYGPPAVCRAFYDRMSDSQGDMGNNHSVRTAESHLSYATMSLRRAVEEVKSFSSMQHIYHETYESEIWNVIKTIKRLVGYEGEAMPKDIRMLIEIADMGISMREALTEPLQTLIVTPYAQLLEKLELVSKALRTQLDRIDQEAEKAREIEGPRSTPDSGIHGCWT